MSQTEAEIVKASIRALRKLSKCWANKIHGDMYQERGVPDIVGCYKGHSFVIEMKRPGKEKHVSVYQAKHLKEYKRAGARAGVASSVEEALAIATGKSHAK